MKAIYKYELSESDLETLLRLPAGSKFLCVKVVIGKPVVYALVDTSIDIYEPRLLRIVPTGEKFDPTGWEYIGTFLLEFGLLVFHVWEKK